MEDKRNEIEMKALAFSALCFISIEVFSQNFLMPVDCVYSVIGRGTMVTGVIERGIINTGDPVEIVGMGARNLTSLITGVEMSQRLANRGEAGDSVGLLLLRINTSEIKKGMVICKPGSVTAHSKLKAQVHFLSKEEGGNHAPFSSSYRLEFGFRTVNITGEIKLPTGVELVMPGENVSLEIKLINKIAMERGLRFVIREGGRTVGSGEVKETLD
jgi:elongation factor Tu